MRFTILFSLLATVISCAQKPVTADSASNVKNSKTLRQMSTPAKLSVEQILISKSEDIEIKGDKVHLTAQAFSPESHNGNVCILAKVTSSKLSDYSQSRWSSRLEVDGQVQKTALTISPLQLIGTTNDSLAAEFTVQGCTKATFAKVGSISFSFKDQRHKTLAQFDWSMSQAATGPVDGQAAE